MNALEQAVAAARVSDLKSASRHDFTTARDQAILGLRRVGRPWACTIPLLRAALAVSEQALVRAERVPLDKERVVGFQLGLRNVRWEPLEVGGLLPASLRVDSASVGNDVPSPSERWRRLVGTAVNLALATDPVWVELRLPTGGRRWERDAKAAAEVDPYRERAASATSTGQALELWLAHPAASLTARVRRWVGTAEEPADQIAREWSMALARPLTPGDLDDGVLVTRDDPQTSIALGDYARWWPRDSGGLWLTRDGIVVAEIEDMFSRLGLSSPGLEGRVECASVRLDVEGRSVVEDEAMHTLVAWLLAAQERAGPSGSTSTPQWASVEQVRDALGNTTAVAELATRSEVVYAWPHQLERYRSDSTSPAVVALSPPELAWLRANTAVVLVPARAFAPGKRLQKVDLTALAQGSVGPLAVSGDGPMLQAFVHRHPVAARGSVHVQAWRRAVGTVADDTPRGVTLVVHAADDGARASAPDDDDVQAMAAAAIARSRTHESDLLREVFDEVEDDDARWRIPLVTHRLQTFGAPSIGLRYEATEQGVQLAWSDDPVLRLRVARERDGTPRTLLDALHRMREAGGIVVGDPISRWQTLESSVPVWTSWLPSDRGRVLIEQVGGAAAMWTMPVVPEVQLRPGPLASQSHLRASRARVESLLESRSRDPRAADALLGHLLFARAVGEDEFGLGAVPLIPGYDPRALRSRQWVALDRLGDQGYTQVVPPHMVARTIADPVVEASSGLAHALAELRLVRPGAVVTWSATRSETRARPSATRRRGTAREVVLRESIAHRLVAGALTLAPGREEIEVWAKGLRVGSFALSPPWRTVSGRFWLTAAGVKAGHESIRAVALDGAERLRSAAVRAAVLSRPGSERHVALTAFVQRATTPDSPRDRSSSGRRVAPALGSDRLGALLRFALGSAVTVEVSWLSWTAVKYESHGGSVTLTLGGRHPSIKAARAEGASLTELVRAALVVLVELARLRDESPRELDETMTRVLAVLE